MGEEFWGVVFEELIGDMDCDCVPNGLYCVGELVYWVEGPMEGAGIANWVSIALEEL